VHVSFSFMILMFDTRTLAHYPHDGLWRPSSLLDCLAS
jgi:hypothetical protein